MASISLTLGSKYVSCTYPWLSKGVRLHEIRHFEALKSLKLKNTLENFDKSRMTKPFDAGFEEPEIAPRHPHPELCHGNERSRSRT